ncbi:MAG: hypothetical protein PHS92_04730 [Candidatus Gracilibacteria bacterium]|nr:hypothetical protein [Candidatus Gracilibacteria bacterium]
MKKYIYLTFEGFTQEPNGKDTENVQMLGIGEGNTKHEGFEDLKEKNEWLLDTSFEELYCHELKDDRFEYFNLKK